MKILWFLGPSTDRWNGVSKYSHTLISGLDESRVTVEKNEIYYLPRSIKRYLHQFVLFPIKLMFSRKYDVSVLYQEDLAFLIPFSKIVKKPIVLICHHAPQISRGTVIEKLKSIYLRLSFFLIRYADVIIVPSNETKNDLVQKYNISKEKLHVVFNSFEFDGDLESVDQSKKEKLLKKYCGNMSGTERVFLNVGTNESRKNLTSWIKGFAKLNQENNIFIQIGKTLDEKAREEDILYVSENKLNVKFLGFVDEEDLVTFYMLADYYISPSLHEGFGRTVIEAQYYNALVIASKLPIYDEIMGNTYCRVNNPLSPSEWVDAVNKHQEINLSLLEKAKNNSDRFLLSSVLISFEEAIKGHLNE